ncbi:hydrogen peroxide-inducible genes activator [Croceicoccus sp. F390]|uniref:Hydrogen peroxide-inducible genes activator n=1 Tax=Croceicoccus esteveae TaxID=3075597 RepID=A0ABU2ZKN8_9SPHN|nr:hydrogen peroxide-inducible genes activator [Croceicoccus sp. F390]MDT0577166.1 hydrogen peroxide-inducible genes activator [Croceicoccus sp. F390]
MKQTYLPTLKQLQYLVALHEHGHFGRAAENSFVSQSTLSAGIRELETLLGVTLVERTRRVVRFTSLGDRVVAKAHRLLREAEELAELVASAGKPLSGELRMSVIPTIAPFLLPRILPKLRRNWPELKLFLREEPSASAIESLHNGRADCVLLALPYPTGDVERDHIADDQLYVAVPADDPIGASQSVLPAALDETRLLLLEDGHCLREHALAACNRPELRTGAMMVGTSLHTLVQMVDNGLGLTMLPKMALDAGILRDTEIKALPLDSQHASREIVLIWRRNSPRGDEFRLLSAELREDRDMAATDKV